MSRLAIEVQWPNGLGALIEARAADWEPKNWEGTVYDREELREHVITKWSEYVVEGRLVVDGLTPSPSCILC